MSLPEIFCRDKSASRIIILLTLLTASICSQASTVVDFGSKFPEFIKEHPDKSWFIKFYAPWCYHCQQIETTFINVAEKIHHNYDNLIAGQVDCAAHPEVCQKYGVEMFPQILFINKNSHTKYNSAPSAEAIFDFAKRLNGPDVIALNDCKHLKSVVNQHGCIVLSTETDLSSAYFKKFQSLASKFKKDWWFYHYKKACKSINIEKGGLYILKRHSNKAIKFDPTIRGKNQFLEDAIKSWIEKEAFPVYGELSMKNLRKSLDADKLLIVSLLDEYKPARKITHQSRDLNRTMEKIAIRTQQLDDSFLFTWTTDTDLINHISIWSAPVPNVMIVRSDASYKVLIENDLEGDAKVSSIMNDRNIKLFVATAKLDDTSYEGGKSFHHNALRRIYSIARKWRRSFNSDPLAGTVLMLLPISLLLFVLYQNCRPRDVADGDDDDEGDDQNGQNDGGDGGGGARNRRAPMANHIKRD